MKYWNITLYVVDNTHVDPKVQNVSCSALCDCGSKSSTGNVNIKFNDICETLLLRQQL